LRQAAGRRLDAFRTSAERLGVASYETRLIEDETRHGLLLQSRYADLTVLSQDPFHTVAASETDSGGRVRRLPEYLALRGVRPVLVVPHGWQDGGMPASALVGAGTGASRRLGRSRPRYPCVGLAPAPGSYVLMP
jgi:hypothetical protein